MFLLRPPARQAGRVEVPAQPLALPRARVPRDHRRSILADRRIIHLRFDGVLGHERRLLDHLL